MRVLHHAPGARIPEPYLTFDLHSGLGLRFWDFGLKYLCSAGFNVQGIGVGMQSFRPWGFLAFGARGLQGPAFRVEDCRLIRSGLRRVQGLGALNSRARTVPSCEVSLQDILGAT